MGTGSFTWYPGIQYALKSGYVLKQIHLKLVLNNSKATALFPY